MIHCKQCGTEMDERARFCPSCGSTMKLQEEPEEKEQPKRKGMKRWMIRGGVIGVIAIGLGVFLNQLLRTYNPVIADQPSVALPTMYRAEKIPSTNIEATMDGGFITIPLRTVVEKKLVRFFDPEKIQSVPMIAYVTPQGKLVTAMSKSEQCGSEDFYLTGNDIHCAVCPSYWNMASLEAYACCQQFYPDPFPSTVVGNEVRIDPAVIRKWKSRL